MAEDPLVLKRTEEKDLLRDLSARLGAYVTSCKRLEDERDKLDEALKLSTTKHQEERAVLKRALEARDKEITAKNERVSQLTSLSESQAQQLKQKNVQLTKYSDVEEHLSIVQTQLRQERDRHADARAALESARKEKEEAVRQAKQSQLEEKKIKAELETQKALMEKTRLAYEQVLKSKERALEDLIKKKNEELKEAHQGWLKESKDKLKAMEKKLREEHGHVRQQQDLRLKELTEELERRTNDLDEVKAAYRDALKDHANEIENLKSRYRSNAVQWERKLQETDELKEQYHKALVTTQRRFQELINSKIAYDAELMQMKDVLDGEDERRKRRRGPESPAHDTVMMSGNQVQYEDDKPEGVKILAIDLKEDTITVANTSQEVKDLTGWRIHNVLKSQDFRFPRNTKLLARRSAVIRASAPAEKRATRSDTTSRSIPADKSHLELLWSTRGEAVWVGSGDHAEATLINPQGKTVSHMAITRNNGHASTTPPRVCSKQPGDGGVALVTPDRNPAPSGGGAATATRSGGQGQGRSGPGGEHLVDSPPCKVM